MGIAYAMLGASLGYKVKLVMPLNASPERKHILRAYGAEMVFTDPMLGGNEAIRMARELYDAAPERYFYANQYDNPANWQAHYRTTAEEIWQQTGGAHHALRRRAGDKRHIHGHDAPAVRAESGHPLHLPAARLRSERDRGLEVYANVAQARHLRSRAGG